MCLGYDNTLKVNIEILVISRHGCDHKDTGHGRLFSIKTLIYEILPSGQLQNLSSTRYFGAKSQTWYLDIQKVIAQHIKPTIRHPSSWVDEGRAVDNTTASEHVLNIVMKI